MDDAKNKAAAKAVYDDLCAVVEEKGWKYEKFDDDLVITFELYGEDIPMDFIFMADADRQLLKVFSKLPFTVPEDKRMELAIATCIVSNGLADGSFDYDISKGVIMFRMTASFMESKIGKGLIDYMIKCSCFVVDEYNDKFLALSKGFMTIQDFIKG